MRSLLRLYITGAIALYLTTRFIPGFSINGSILDFLLVAVIFTIVQKIVKPLIHMLLLPFHFLTLGTIAWVVNLLALYVLTFFIAKVKIMGFHFDGYVTPFFVVPAMEITPFFTAVLTSFCLGTVGAFLHWLME